MRMVERCNSELDHELLHPAQRMTNPYARSPNHRLSWNLSNAVARHAVTIIYGGERSAIAHGAQRIVVIVLF